MHTGPVSRAALRALAVLIISLTAVFIPPGRAAHASSPGAVLEDARGDTELNELGFAAFREKRFGEAVRFFRLAIAKNPSAKNYYNNEAAALMNEGKYGEAYEALNKALEIDPAFCKALSNMAITCFHLNRFRESYAFFRRAREADRAYTDERFERGRVIEKLKSLNEQQPENRDIETIYERLKNGIVIPEGTGF